jgi:hypothetical protein
MYIPAHFAVDDVATRELLAKHGAADLITLTADGLLATMLPFVYLPELGERGTLYGHVARNNDQWRKPAIGESLAIMRGPDAYIRLPGTHPRPRTAGWSRPGTTSRHTSTASSSCTTTRSGSKMSSGG